MFASVFVSVKVCNNMRKDGSRDKYNSNPYVVKKSIKN